MKSLLLAVVILNPYEGLNYDEINVYTFDKKYTEEVMTVYEAEEPEEEALAEYFKKKYFEEEDE